MLFLSRVNFSHVDGKQVDITIKLITAATAVMLVFNSPLCDLPRVKHIVFHDGALVEEEAGLVVGAFYERSVFISMKDFYDGLQDPKDGDNVVIHEFAHAIDASSGEMD